MGHPYFNVNPNLDFGHKKGSKIFHENPDFNCRLGVDSGCNNAINPFWDKV